MGYAACQVKTHLRALAGTRPTELRKLTELLCATTTVLGAIAVWSIAAAILYAELGRKTSRAVACVAVPRSRSGDVGVPGQRPCRGPQHSPGPIAAGRAPAARTSDREHAYRLAHSEALHHRYAHTAIHERRMGRRAEEEEADLGLWSPEQAAPLTVPLRPLLPMGVTLPLSRVHPGTPAGIGRPQQRRSAAQAAAPAPARGGAAAERRRSAQGR
eukprot:scaffold1298_cov382-Prasinococcus_capsulatus_cf.AAC.27